MLPGHAIVLLPGVWLGMPGLMPVVLAGGTAAMIIVLARRLAGVSVAVLSVALWISQAGQQRWRASYLSESTTALCWLVGWWCLLRWRDDQRPRWLLGMATVTGLAAVTRPLTALAFAIPAGVVVLRYCWIDRGWRQLGYALAAGTAILTLVPLQNLTVLGDWRASPLALYTRQYMPFDRLGFGLDQTRAELALTPELDTAFNSLRERHMEHMPAALPGVFLDRFRVLTRSVFSSWRAVFIPAAAIGLVVLPPAGWLAVVTAAGLLLLYLPYAHEAHWSVYYTEAMPIPAMVVAMGVVAVLHRVGRCERSTRWGALGFAAVSLGMAAPELEWSGLFKRAAQEPLLSFQSRLADLPARKMIVFVRYSDGFDGHHSFVHNVADPFGARVLTAHDLGKQVNDQVRAAFPDRVAYLFDTGSERLEELEAVK
ncbi:MAG: hypothetical protein SFU57_08435 [Gemmatimonadales bacterium]|nr:hypothetical protein [Gemmatimonadales bacterium]